MLKGVHPENETKKSVPTFEIDVNPIRFQNLRPTHLLLPLYPAKQTSQFHVKIQRPASLLIILHKPLRLILPLFQNGQNQDRLSQSQITPKSLEPEQNWM